MEFSLLLEARFEGGAEGVKSQVALGLQNLIGQFLLLLFKVGGIGLFFFRNAIHKPVCADIQRGTNITGLELKGGGNLLPADGAGDGAAASEEIAGFRFEAEGFGGGFKFFAGFDALGEIFGFRAGQEGGLLLLQLSDDFVADFFQGARVSGLNLFHGEDDVAAVGANGQAEFILAKTEDGVLGLFGVAQLENGVDRAQRASFADREMELFGEIVQGNLVGTADGGGELIGLVAGQLVDLTEQRRNLDRVFYFLEGLGVRGFFVEDFDDVEAILGFHQVGNFAFVEAEGGFLEFGHGLALRNPAQVAAFVLGAGIFGVFLGEIVELGAFFGLLEDVFSLLPDFLDLGVGLADGH